MNRHAGAEARQNLIERAKHGDHDAFVQLIDAHEHVIRCIVRTFLRRIEGYEEDDLVNEVILSAYRVMPTFRGDEKALLSFLRRTTRGICLNLVNRKKYEQTDLQEPIDEIPPGPDENYAAKATRECVQKAIALLPEKLKAVIILHDLEEVQYDEIAHVLKIPIGTVKSRINRGREQLERLFKELRCKELL